MEKNVLIKVSILSFKRKENLILDSITYEFFPGKLYVIKGKNGSGKSTFLKLLSGLTDKYSGSINIQAQNLKSSNDFLGFEKGFSGLKNIRIINAFTHYEHEDLANYIKMFQMNGYINKKIKKMSSGMQAKTSLICTLVSKPDILILDEPYNNLDIVSRKYLNEFLIEYLKENLIILSIHNEDEINIPKGSVEILNFINGKLS